MLTTSVPSGCDLLGGGVITVLVGYRSPGGGKLMLTGLLDPGPVPNLAGPSRLAPLCTKVVDSTPRSPDSCMRTKVRCTTCVPPNGGF